MAVTTTARAQETRVALIEQRVEFHERFIKEIRDSNRSIAASLERLARIEETHEAVQRAMADTARHLAILDRAAERQAAMASVSKAIAIVVLGLVASEIWHLFVRP